MTLSTADMTPTLVLPLPTAQRQNTMTLANHYVYKQHDPLTTKTSSKR